MANLKVILENCDLKSLESIYKASYVALEAGADFVKTSTGKLKILNFKKLFRKRIPWSYFRTLYCYGQSFS